MSVADSTMTRTKAYPAQGASNQTDSVDLGADRVGAIGNRLTLHLILVALATLADGETVAFTLQDSADNVTFDDLLTLDAAKRTGAGGNGSEAKEERLFLPPDTRRFIRMKATVSGGAGDLTGSEYKMEFRV